MNSYGQILELVDMRCVFLQKNDSSVHNNLANIARLRMD